MMIAFGDKFTNVPPLYFVLGWLWARAFGVTELSLRLFSALGMSVACFVTWITLRRNYRFWPTVIGTLGAFCVADLVLTQNAEARMYGLFLAVCSLGVLEFDVINRKQYCSTATLLVNALIHAAIVQTHLFGIIYSGAILCAFIIRDRFFNLFRPRVYLSIVVGWLSLIPYIPTFLNQADAGNPRAWIPMPDLNHLTSVLVPSASSVSFGCYHAGAYDFGDSICVQGELLLEMSSSTRAGIVGDRGIPADIGFSLFSRSSWRVDCVAHGKTSVRSQVHDPSHFGLGDHTSLSGFEDYRAWKIAIARDLGT